MRYETDKLVLRDFTSNDFNDWFDYIMEQELQYMPSLNNINDIKYASEIFNSLMENKENSQDYTDCEYAVFNEALKELQEKSGFKYKCCDMFDDVDMFINIIEKD